uniref:Uncharacterized protein C16C10.8 n=1 Tax=Cajanus cajan TaxID=3821 RepID=A0A151SRX8_CAJCA|nr:Uncharacterized protein C16C10.8 [Cajanus cajan]
MVWFQCEDCGDNLKKPKLSSHFRTCSAYKLSCIDCGEIFGRDTVQDHMQCITEAEKYGPKGQGKSLNVATAKPNKDSKERPEVDINVGLSERPPWFCSLCNTKTTSKQTLLLHADGKKHRAKARAFHASKQQPVEADKSSPDAKKKRKLDELEDDLVKKSRNDTSVDMGNGEVIQGEEIKGESNLKRKGMLESHCTSAVKNKIKWKKFIKSALKSHPDGILKMKKLRKAVFKELQESGIVMDEAEMSEALEQKINSSSRFAVENKYVRLLAKD